MYFILRELVGIPGFSERRLVLLVAGRPLEVACTWPEAQSTLSIGGIR